VVRGLHDFFVVADREFRNFDVTFHLRDGRRRDSNDCLLQRRPRKRPRENDSVDFARRGDNARPFQLRKIPESTFAHSAVLLGHLDLLDFHRRRGILFEGSGYFISSVRLVRRIRS